MKEAENIPADGNVRMEPKVGGRTTAGQQQRQASLGVVCAGKIIQEVGYSWTQTEEELEISIILPREMTDDDDGNSVKSKEIQVQFKPHSVVVIYRKVTLLQLELFERVSIDGCTWMLDRQTQKGDNNNNNNNTLVVVVTMEKVEQALWPRIQN